MSDAWPGTAATSRAQTSTSAPLLPNYCAASNAALATLPETRQLVAREALRHLFTNSFFDICTVRNLVAMAGRSENTPAFQLLRTLHCVHYVDMDPQLRDQLPQLVNEALRPPPHLAAVDVAAQGVDFT